MQPFQRLFSFLSSVRRSISKNCSVPPILPFLILLGSLAWVSPAGFAASFDCTKAGTAIEKMICADPAISKLDEDLAAAFREALASALDKEALRRQQREWLTQSRDWCRDPGCLKAAYQQRLAQMKTSPMNESAGAEVAKDRKYPPYPEVWGFGDVRMGTYYLCSAKDGDFYIFSGSYYKDTPKTAIRGFFSGALIELPPKEAEAVARDGKPVAGLGQLRCGEYYNYEISLSLSNGYTVKRECVGGSCQSPFGIGIKVIDKSQRVVARKVILHLADTPEKMEIPWPLAEGGRFSITGRVFPTNPYFILLEDDTFLVFSGALLRFDAHLNSKYLTNDGPVFAVDTTVIEQIYREASEKAPQFSEAWTQFVYDRTAKLLAEKSKKEKRP